MSFANGGTKPRCINPPFAKLLIANRGEIAIRIARAAAELGIAASRSTPRTIPARCTPAPRRRGASRSAGRGPGLSRRRPIIALAKATGCGAMHPGYGFLAENAGFARDVAAAGLIFVGPRPQALELFGDKVAARELASGCGVPIIPGAAGACAEDARAFFAAPRRRRHDAEGRGRRRRPRHARRARDAANSPRLSTLRSEAAERVRRRRALCREALRAGAPYRGSGCGRRRGASSRSASANARCSGGTRS